MKLIVNKNYSKMGIQKLNKTLYQIDSKNKLRVWDIKVISLSNGAAEIIINAGLETGKKVETKTPITEGKNKGKSNETTPLEQAIADAQTEINKKLKAGYVENYTKAKPKAETATIKKPLKGEVYDPKLKKNKSFNLKTAGIEGKTIGVQRKLDGWRFRIFLNADDCIFYTSSGDITLPFPQIEESLRKTYQKNIDYWAKKYGVTEYYLDGEIYNHLLGFNATASACLSGGKKTDQSELRADQRALRDQMQFHIFDVCLQAPYTTRQKVANNFVDNVFVLPVETVEMIADEKEIEALFDSFTKNGYEGLMIRQLDMPYEFKRSLQMLKYKPQTDDEFQIVGFNKSIQGETLGSLICAMPDGRQFKTDLKNEFGTDKMKKYIWDNQKDFLGKWVTVVFMEYTQPKDGSLGLPRNPKAKGLRKGKSKD